MIKNLAFHNLTGDNFLPSSCKQLLGLGNKFIPTPPFSTSLEEMQANLSCFHCDMSLKVHFSTETQDDLEDDPTTRHSKLYLSSKWVPDSIVVDVDKHLCHFFNEVSKLFTKKKARSNLHQFQRKLLTALLADDSIVIALSDKGLGHCAVKLIRYIEDALAHLEDEKTYKILSQRKLMQLSANSPLTFENGLITSALTKRARKLSSSELVLSTKRKHRSTSWRK